MYSLRLLLTVLLLALQTSLASVGLANAQEIRVAYDNSVDSPHAPFIKSMQTLLNEQYGNELTLTLLPYDKNRSEKQVVESLLRNEIDLALPSLSSLSEHSSRFMIFDLPFLFASKPTAYAFVHGDYGTRLANSLSAIGLKGFSYLDNGMKQLTSNKPILEPFDLVSTRVGTIGSDVIQQQYMQMGSSAIPINGNDVRQHLNANKINAYETNWRRIQQNQLSDLQPHLLATNHAYMGFLITMSKVFWDKQGEQQKTFQTIFQQAADVANRANNAKIEEAKQLLKVSKLPQINILDAEGRRSWFEGSKTVWEIFEDDIGSELINTAASYR